MSTLKTNPRQAANIIKAAKDGIAEAIKRVNVPIITWPISRAEEDIGDPPEKKKFT